MPLLLEHIDAIARQIQRGVLYLEFHPLARAPQAGENLSAQDVWAWKTMPDSAWQALPIRQQVIDWLDAQGIGWQPCGHFADVGLMMGYRGQLYIDLPYDQSLPSYQALEAFLENPDGTMRYREALFFYCSLEEASKNATHDAPGFWARWAENF